MKLKHCISIAVAAIACVWLAGCAATSAFRKGNDLASAEDWDRAVYYYSKALALEPQNVEYKKSLDLAKVKASQSHFQLAKQYMEAKAFDLAIVEYRVAATLDPTNRFVSDSLEVALARKKEKEQEAETADKKSEIEKLKEETQGAGLGPVLRPSSEAPMSLNFPPNTKVKDIYVALGKAAGINVLFDSGIRDQETFSIDIANISFKKALDQVALANKHFYKVIDSKTIMIVPDNPQKRRDFEDHVIKTFYLSNANPNDVVNTLRGLLDARRIATNVALNAITIRDTPAKIAVMERVIQSNDKPPSEVVIDVEILEVRKTHDFTLGTTLSSYAVAEVLEQPDTVAGSSLSGLRLSNIPYINASDWLFTFPSLLYRAETNNGNVRAIARPSLRALDGKQVTLRLGDQVPIETSTVLGTGVGGTTRNFQFRDIGTNIDITPRIHHNGEVTLQLQVELTSVGTDPDGPGGPVPPTFGNRRINTEIRLKDGETNLLAGLFQSQETSSHGGLPILSTLPVLHWLFASNAKSHAETDIVLTLTPHIVRTPNIQRNDLEPFYVGTESNIGGIGDVSMGSTFGGSPFTPPAGGEDEGGGSPRPAPGRPTPVQRPPGFAPGTFPGQPGGQPGQSAFPGQPSGGTTPTPVPAPQPIPTPFNPEPNQPSPTGVLPAGGLGGPPEAPGRGAVPVATPPLGDAIPTVSPVTPTPAPAVAPAVIALAPASQSVAVDKEFTVDVVIEGGTGVSHAPFWLTFNPAVLEALAVSEGNILNRDGNPTQFLSAVLANRVVVGLSRTGRGAGVDGSGVLATVRFRAKAAGESPLAFASASLRDSQSQPLPATFVPGKVTVP